MRSESVDLLRRELLAVLPGLEGHHLTRGVLLEDELHRAFEHVELDVGGRHQFHLRLFTGLRFQALAGNSDLDREAGRDLVCAGIRRPGSRDR